MKKKKENIFWNLETCGRLVRFPRVSFISVMYNKANESSGLLHKAARRGDNR